MPVSKRLWVRVGQIAAIAIALIVLALVVLAAERDAAVKERDRRRIEVTPAADASAQPEAPKQPAAGSAAAPPGAAPALGDTYLPGTKSGIGGLHEAMQQAQQQNQRFLPSTKAGPVEGLFQVEPAAEPQP